jgi:hypothetical protein
MRIAAVCAIYGGYDLIPPVPEGVDDAVLVTDIPVRSGWRNVVEPSSAHPRLAAKRPRCRPDLYTDCEASLWMDGSIHVLDDRFVRLVRERLAQHELVLWDHPEDRDCFLEEARHCHDWPKYRDGPLLAQAEHYRAEGMPEHFGLWATGSIARRHTDRMRSLGDAWLAEMERWTVQDQVSLPYLLWREGIVPGTFGIDQLDNDLVVVMAHADELRRYRLTKLGLEERVIHAEGRADHLEVMLANLTSEHERLRARRAVRSALWLAGLTKPLRRRAAGHGSPPAPR